MRRKIIYSLLIIVAVVVAASFFACKSEKDGPTTLTALTDFYEGLVYEIALTFSACNCTTPMADPTWQGCVYWDHSLVAISPLTGYLKLVSKNEDGSITIEYTDNGTWYTYLCDKVTMTGTFEESGTALTFTVTGAMSNSCQGYTVPCGFCSALEVYFMTFEGTIEDGAITGTMYFQDDDPRWDIYCGDCDCNRFTSNECCEKPIYNPPDNYPPLWCSSCYTTTGDDYCNNAHCNDWARVCDPYIVVDTCNIEETFTGTESTP